MNFKTVQARHALITELRAKSEERRGGKAVNSLKQKVDRLRVCVACSRERELV